MFSLFLLLCFKIHTNHKRSIIKEDDDLPKGCGEHNGNIGNEYGWYNYGELKNNHKITCNPSLATNPKVVLRGGDFLKIKTPVVNQFPNGLIDILDADFDCSLRKFWASGCASSKVQLINLAGSGLHVITGTIFEFCGVFPFGHNITNNKPLPDNWDPTLICIEGSSTNEFTSVTFTHPKNGGNPQGWELRQTRPIRIEGSCSLNLSNGNFYNSSCYKKGSFLWLGANAIYISNCNFEECVSIINECHAIWITNEREDNVIITDCNFLDCGKNSQGFVIQADVSGFTFRNNNMSFSSSNSSGCIQCHEKGEYIFENNIFSNAVGTYNDNDRWRGVAIDYKGNTGSGRNKPENLVFNGNTFDNIKGVNEGRCLSLDLKDGTLQTLESNFIQNCPLGRFFIKIMQRKKIQEFNLKGWKFTNNIVSDKYGGGGGIWIENEVADSSNSHTFPYNLTLESCIFKNNVCEQKGGAFQIGMGDNDNNRYKYVVLVEVKITECEFINNTAEKGGGAIAIQTNYPLTINNCKFIDNYSPDNGGAIYIEPNVTDPSKNNQQMPSASIQNCYFRGNSGKEAHCIFIVDGPKTIIDIFSCEFYNNYGKDYASGSCILSRSFQLTASSCHFTNDNLEHSSGGINITSRCILKVTQSTFVHCSAGNIENSYGGGIGYASLDGDSTREEDITIDHCTFDGCGGKNGVAVLLKPHTFPIISNIDIKNHVLTSWIFCIFFQFETDTESFQLENIKFLNNNFDAGKNEIGGGTGIWIAESEDINYDKAFNLVFDRCTFTNNNSPENGGAFSYGGSPRLQSVELTFDTCTFQNNRCEHYFGGACRFETIKPVSLINCDFTNNTAASAESGGGAIFFGERVESVHINDCTFSDCYSSRGSFIFTQGAMKNINISKCTFRNLQEGQSSSVHIIVNSKITQFIFDSNIFEELKCAGEDGGAGLHISNGAECNVSNCKFNNCAGKDKNNGVITINSAQNPNSALIFNLCDFNNEEGRGDPGERPIYISADSLVQLNSCRFLSYNKGENIDGTILYSKSTLCTDFFNCSFSSLKGNSLIRMDEAKSADIHDCQFTECVVIESLILADKAEDFTALNNVFSDNKGHHPIKFGNLVRKGLISNNTFQICVSSEEGGALYITGNDLDIEIKDNLFEKCTATDGLAIYATDKVNNLDIHDCNFTNNHKEGSFTYTIHSLAGNLRFIDSKIEYKDEGNSKYLGGGIKIGISCSAEINNVKFINLHIPSAIYYDVVDKSNETTTVSNCLFDGFNPSESSDSRELYSAFQFGEGLNVEFYNNTIKDHNNAGSDWGDLRVGLIDGRIENCTFTNNNVKGLEGGGSGLCFNGDAQVVNCHFEKNKAKFNTNGESDGKGGAIQFSGEKTIEIDSCIFINNRADLEGGALSIQCANALIYDSTFTSNLAAQQSFGNSDSNFKMGGAIYFNSNKKGSIHELKTCVFKSNTADSNGHALYISGENTIVCVSDLCYFEDNSRTNGGSQIFINEKAKLDFSNSTVCLKNLTSKSRGIELSSGTLNAHHTEFSKVEASKQGNKIEGNAILVNSGDNNAIIEDNLFKDCYIKEQGSFAVTFNGTELSFLRNTFDFSPGRGCGCLRIYTTGKINVEGNIFQNANTPANFHGVFMYEETHRDTDKNHAVISNNIFQYCTSKQTACFQFKWRSQDYEFIDNTFQHNNLNNYLGEFDFMGEKHNEEFFCGRNHFINNTGRSTYGGGTGLWFQNKVGIAPTIDQHFTIILDGCQFNGNRAAFTDSRTDKERKYSNGNGGAIQFGWSESISNVDLIVRNCSFINNIADMQGGALSIQIIGYTIIDGCTFTGNKAGQGSDENQAWGGAIYANPDFDWANGHYSQSEGGPFYSENITIENCKFNNNRARDATSIYIQSSQHTNFFVTNTQFVDNYNMAFTNFSIVSEAKEFVFEDSKIEFTNKQRASSGIRTTSKTTITNSHFLRNKVNNNKTIAEALLVDSKASEIEISDTTFEDCGGNGGDYSVVKVKNQNAYIHHTTFNYSSLLRDNSCQPVLIQEFCNCNFYKNRITNSYCRGAFEYRPPKGGNKNNEKIRIEDCIFEKCQGRSARALKVALYTGNITFYNNTIQDCPLCDRNEEATGYLFVFDLLSPELTEFTVDTIIFRNLSTNSDFGGGCGGWVGPHSKNVRYKLNFRNCIFEDNHAYTNRTVKECENGKGGALQYGHTDSISNVDLTIDGCEFIRNAADQEGGALCLMIQGNIEITNCTFKDNTAGVKDQFCGGAIAIIPEYGFNQNTASDLIEISGCSFSGNTGYNANAIYVSQGPRTDLVINENCKFLDNTKESGIYATIMAETRKLEVDDSVFNFTTLTKSCNAISTNATTVILDGSKFYHCYSRQPSHGSALNVSEITKSCIINDCKFIDNGKNHSTCVISTEASSFEFSFSEISYTLPSASDRGMYIPKICKFHVTNSLFRHCYFDRGNNNGACFFYEGVRRASHTEDIKLENILFDSNNNNYASCFFMKPSTVPILKNITAKNHQRGNFGIVIIFQSNVREEILVDECTFDNNRRDQSNADKPDCGGSGLWIACANQSIGYLESYRITFSQCTFKNNVNNYLGGAFAYGYSPTLRYIFLDFVECTFADNTCEGEMGGALAFNGQVPVTITRSLFTGNKCNSTNYRGHCIYIHHRCKAIINDCTFIDNGIYGNGNAERDANGHSIIQCSGAKLELNRCILNFTDPTVINSRFIDIDYHSVVNLVNTTFANVNAGKLWGGSIHLNKNETSILDEQITIDSCVFENNYADNGCAALLWATAVPTLINLSFKNQTNGKYVFCVFFKAFRDTCTVENTVFENCTSANEDGGGSSLWIANVEEISHGRPFELTFHNCTWRNNAAAERGGAIHYGNSKTLVGVQMSFEQCHFIGNHAKEEGGAVSLVTKSPIVFSDCTFRNNYVEAPKTRASTVGTRGGSISINSKTPLVQISGCSFTNETSDNGNAIFIHDKVQACLISGCTFKNCGKTGTVIVSETLEFMLLNSEVSFDRTTQSCRAIEIRTISVTTISQSTFRNCHSSLVGAGIYLNNSLASEEQEDFTLENCIFDGCESDVDGCAMFLNVSSAPVLRGLTFQNHKFDKNVTVILNYNDFQDLFSIQSCKFISNRFQNTLKQDGGGCAMFIANCKVSLESFYKISFEDCTWSKNTASFGGAFSYGTNNFVKNVEHVFERCTFNTNTATGTQGGALYLSTSQLILFDQCTFNDNKCHDPNVGKQGGAVYIAKCSSVSITGTTFKGNSALNGHALWIEDIPSANIFGCTFDSNNLERKGAQIVSKCAELVLYDTDIKFDATKIQARGIEIQKQGSYSFVNCKLLNCQMASAEKGGAINILEDTVTNRTEALTLDTCLFDNCQASNGAAIHAYLTCNPTIRGCTISNNDQGRYIFSIFFRTAPTGPRFVQIEDCTFEGNYFAGDQTSDAGGIGLWIAYKKDLKVEYPLTLTFNGCKLISNRCGKNGGAFAYGESNTLKNISLNFNDCIFKENACDEGTGGALYISTVSPLIITNCHFINNKCNGANTKGSAIYVNSPSEKVQIIDSTFENGQSLDGVGIYSDDLTKNLIIEKSSFNNCASAATGSVICSRAPDFHLQESNITFDLDANIKCRGLLLVTKAKATISKVRFINCQSDMQGGGINIDFQTGNDEESITIKDVVIDNADATNGCAVMIKTNVAPIFEDITIRNCTSGHYVFVVFFKSYVYEAKLTRCIFENNQFVHNGFPANPDAGGSGIWVANDGQRDDDKDKHLIFDTCSWIGNSVKDTSTLKYGGGFAWGHGLTSKQTQLTFTGCRFVGNSAPERGGALYLASSLPVTLSRCLFDGNEAADGSSIYAETTSNVTIEYVQIARNKATQNGAAFIKSTQHLQMLNVTFTENTGPTATSLYLQNEGVANIENCNFDFSRGKDQYQIRLHGESSSASITFRMGCFIHTGDNNGNTHIYSTHKGAVNIPAGNCFDTSQNVAINNQGGSINAGSGVFDCHKCGSIYVPTIAPDATPSASPAIETSVPSDIPSEAPSTITSSSSSQSGGSSSSSTKKKNTKIIAMIAGITAAIVVVIVVIIILIWLFVFRKRSAAGDNNSDNASEMNDEQITEISGIADPGQDDPIWAGTNQDNPLFNGGDDQDEDQMIHNDFEESWGDSVI